MNKEYTGWFSNLQQSGWGGGWSWDVTWPASSTDNAVARFNWTTWKIIQNSWATISDTWDLTANNFSWSSSWTNTWDQTSIVGITGTSAQFNTALTDWSFATWGGTATWTNTWDQTITLTGDVTWSGTWSFAATIASDSVTYDKMQDTSTTDVILGRSTAWAGTVEEIACTSAGRALLDDANAAAQRTTLWLWTLATQSTIDNGDWSGADLAVVNGGTWASDAATARTNLWLVIWTNVQAWDADLDTWATKTAPTGTVVWTSDTQTLTNKTLDDPKIEYTLNTQTGTTYTLALTDQTKIVEMNNASANTITIPTNASVAFAIWTTITVVQYGAWLTTVQWDTWVTVNWTSAWSKATTAQYEWLALYKRGSDERIIINK